MPLRGLPDDILVVLLAVAARHPSKPELHFCTSLPLLAVCRHWRQLALPAVYSRAVCKCDTRPLEVNGARVDSSATAELERPRVVTNLGLIATAGCARFVKELQLTGCYVYDPLPGLAMAVAQLLEVATGWKRLGTLRLNLDGLTSNYNNVPLAGASDEAIQRLTDNLVGVAPGIGCLIPANNVYSAAARTLLSRVAARYANQLQAYSGKYVTLPPECVFQRLVAATISRGYDRQVLPRIIHTRWLRYLELSCLPLEGSWDMFVSDNNGGDIVFPELLSLNITYHGVAIGDSLQDMPTLHFPKLRTLRLYSRTVAFLLLQQTVVLPELEKMEIVGTIALFRTLETTRVPATRRLHVVIESDKSKPDALVHLDRFLARARGCMEKELFIRDGLPRVLPESLLSADLTSLNVQPQLGIDGVLLLIEHHQQLQRLKCHHVVFDEAQADISIAPLYAHAREEPLSISLQRLYLWFRGEGDEDVPALAAKYLLIRLPSLASFVPRSGFPRPILVFAQEYSTLYPHLQNADSVLYGLH